MAFGIGGHARSAPAWLAMVKIGRATGYIDKTGRYMPIL